jgi:hypothetical protein
VVAVVVRTGVPGAVGVLFWEEALGAVVVVLLEEVLVVAEEGEGFVVRAAGGRSQ